MSRRWVRPPPTPRPVLLLGMLAVSACRPPPAAAPASTAQPAAERVAGLQVISLPRPTPGWIHLSLWIDAGSRDAHPPQVATVAALTAAARGHAEARVLPDGTEIARSCPTGELQACARDMLRMLGTRAPGADEVGAALETVVARRRAAATDAERMADAAALEALLGDVARGWQPLGRAEGDPAVTPQTVGAFLDATYGPARALLIAAGDVTQRAIVAAVDQSRPKLPSASTARPARPRLDLRSAVQTVQGSDPHVSVATWAPSAEAAAARAEMALARVRARLSGSFGVRTFAVRGGAMILLHARDPVDPAKAGAELSYALGLVVREAPRPSGRSSEGSHATPPEAARAWGRRWVAQSPRSGSTSPSRAALAIGAAVPEPERIASTLRRGFEEARSWLDPVWRGTLEPGAASVVLGNGARLRVLRRDYGGRVAIAIRYAGGSSEEPAGATGSTALASSVWATVCPALGPGWLETRLRDLGARVQARVDSRGLGILIEADASRWREAVDLAWQCTPWRDVTGADVERARRSLLAHMTPRAQLAAWAARVLSPQRPGLVATTGHPASLGDIDRTELDRVLGRHLVGARLTTAVVGAVPVDEAVSVLARRAAALPPGKGPGRVELGPPGPPVESERWEGPLARVVIGWRAEGSFPGRADEARAFARAMREALEQAPGVRALADGGDADVWGAWAALMLELEAAGLEGLPEQVRTVLGSWRGEIARVRAQSSADARWEAARHRHAALALVRSGGVPRQPDSGVAARLAEDAPRYVIGRPPAAR